MYALTVTLGVFALVLVLSRLKVPLAAALMIGAVGLGFLFEMNVSEVLFSILSGMIWPRTIVMTLMTFLLLGLSTMMNKAGQFERLVSHACLLLRRPAIAMAVMPALVGLQPMPGGALFSAPMVKAAAGKSESRGAILSGVNFWFRHIWESWWPLYPAVILAAEETNRTLGEFIPIQMPLCLFMVLSGLFILRKVHPNLHVTGPKAPRGTLGKLLWSLSSLILIAMVWGLVSLIIHFTWPVNPDSAIRKYLPIIIALVASIVWTTRFNCMSISTAASTLFKNKKPYAMALVVASVMVFGFMLEKTEAGTKMADELERLNVPVMAVVIILPFIAGLVTGIAVGFVGTTFAILVPLILNAEGLGSAAIPSYMLLAFSFGHIGQLLSPVHVCQIVSNQYFKTSFSPMYRQIIPPAMITGTLTIAYFLVLRMFGT
ncbi:MAG TPA: DUF401 family protein [Phycisphaerae bacterium]|nr:DUF401 family protein [Phycisphaerae bacterium]